MQCTICHSDNVQKLSLVYEQGTQNIKTTGRTRGGVVGLGRGGLMVGGGGGVTTTRGKSQSIAAQKAAPPEKKKIIIAIALIVVGVFLFSYSFPLALLVAGGGGYLFWKFSQYNNQTFPPLYAQWEKSWLCNKCGSIFVMELPLASNPSSIG